MKTAMLLLVIVLASQMGASEMDITSFRVIPEMPAPDEPVVAAVGVTSW